MELEEEVRNLRRHRDETQGIVTLVANLDFVSRFLYSVACFCFSARRDRWPVLGQGYTSGFSGCLLGREVAMGA